MTVAELRTILEHLPDGLEVHIAGHGEITSVRVPYPRDLWTHRAVYVDVRGQRLKGVFTDRRTLDVRLEALAQRAAS